MAHEMILAEMSTDNLPATLHDVVDRHNAIVEMMQYHVLVKGTDYGEIPGTKTPTLLQPGAQKIAERFHLVPTYEMVAHTEHWYGANGNPEPLFYYHIKCKLWREGKLMGEGIGSCNSWEKKYRYRDAKPVCPKCAMQTIYRSKDGSGFYCWKKMDGCGATFPLDDPIITSQPTGREPNPEVFDQVNTFKKMAAKRAFVHAVIQVTAASQFFTQDVEYIEVVDASYTVEDVPPEPAPQPPRQRRNDRAELERDLNQILPKHGIALSQSERKELEQDEEPPAPEPTGDDLKRHWQVLWDTQKTASSMGLLGAHDHMTKADIKATPYQDIMRITAELEAAIDEHYKAMRPDVAA